MAGKKIFWTLINILFLCPLILYAQTASQPTLIGGLIFEKQLSKPTYLNQNEVTIVQRLDTKTPMNAAHLLEKYTHIYHRLCDELERKVKATVADPIPGVYQYNLITSEKPTFLAYATATCRNLGGRVPEIRDIDSYNQVLQYARQHKITTVTAGIHFDKPTATFRFNSDDVNARDPGIFTNIIRTVTGIEYPGEYEKDYYLRLNGPERMYDYRLQNGKLQLHETETDLMWNKTIILCEKKIVYDKIRDNLVLDKMTLHHCQRDKDNLKASTNQVLLETQAILSLNITADMLNLTPFRTISQRSAEFEPDDDDNTVQCTHEICRRNVATKAIIMYTSKQLAMSIDCPESVAIAFIGYKTLLAVGAISYFHFNEFINILNTTANMHRASPDFHQDSPWSYVHHLTEQAVAKSAEENLFTEELNNRLEASTIISDHLVESVTDVMSTKYRVKRALGTILGAGAVANTVTNMGTDSAPLSWFGDPMANLFGWAKKTETRQNLQSILANAHSIETLSINQQELSLTTNLLTKSLNSITSWTVYIEKALTTMYHEQDIKGILRYIQLLLQTTLNKISQIMLQAFLGITSPYLMTQDSLDAKVAYFGKQGIHITSNLQDLKTTIIYSDEEILFLTSIPMLENEKLFDIFTVKPIPIFTEQGAFMAQPSSSILAISATGSEYTTLTESERRNCVEKKTCTSSMLYNPVTSTSECAIQTYLYKNVSCPMTKIQHSSPFFAFYDNVTIYSVPSNTTVSITCSIDRITKQETLTLSGSGTAFIQQGCTLLLSDGRRFATKPIPLVHRIHNTMITSMLKYIPQISAFEIPTERPEAEAPPIRMVTLQPVITSHKQSIFEKLTNPTEALTFTSQFFTVIAILLALLTIPCCFPKVRLWFMSCCFWKKPSHWWARYRNMEFLRQLAERNPRLQQAIEATERHPTFRRLHRIFRPRIYPEVPQQETSSAHPQQPESQQPLLHQPQPNYNVQSLSIPIPNAPNSAHYHTLPPVNSHFIRKDINERKRPE